MNTRDADSLLGRIFGFTGRYPLVMDAVVALLMGLVGFPSWPSASLETPAQAVFGFVVIAGCIAIVFRRRYPRACLAVLAVLMVIHIIAVRDASAFAMGVCLLAAYTTQTQLERGWRWIFLGLLVAGSGVAVLLAEGPVLGTDRSLGFRAIQVLTGWLGLLVAVLIGAIRRYRRNRVELAFERAALLEAQQDAERRLAASEERARIAREIHDILGHSLNVIAVQAEGARQLLDSDPDAAREALARIGGLSRAAVDEVRNVVDVLHAVPESAPLSPAPKLVGLPELVDEYRAGGAEIRLRISGDLQQAPDAVGLAGYRIVQESLTNAIRHAPGAPIMVTVSVENGGVDLVVVNGAAGSSAAEADGQSRATGHGLIGMRERVRAFAGSFTAGPDAITGGWKVEAYMPGGRA